MSPPPPPSPTTVTGEVIDGYVRGATVFVDANKNGVFDSGETFTTTDTLGNFTLTVAPSLATFPIVVTGGVDITTGLRFEGS